MNIIFFLRLYEAWRASEVGGGKLSGGVNINN